MAYTIAFVLDLGDWSWSLHSCVLYPLKSRQLSLFDISFKNKKSIPRALMYTIAVSASIFKDITVLLAACIGILGFTGPL